MNKKTTTAKKTETKKAKATTTTKKEATNNVIKMSTETKPKQKTHPFSNFIERRQSENKFANPSNKSSMQNIPYRKKAV